MDLLKKKNKMTNNILIEENTNLSVEDCLHKKKQI